MIERSKPRGAGIGAGGAIARSLCSSQARRAARLTGFVTAGAGARSTARGCHCHGGARQLRARHRGRRPGGRGGEPDAVRQRARHRLAQGARRRRGVQGPGARRHRQPRSDRQAVAGGGDRRELRIDWQRAQLDAERKLSQLEDAFEQAQVDRNTAQRELDRSRKAYELGSYTELQALKAQDALEKAQFALRAGEAELRVAAEAEPLRHRQQEGAATTARNCWWRTCKRQVDG